MSWSGSNRSRSTLALRLTFSVSTSFLFLTFGSFVLFSLPCRFLPFDIFLPSVLIILGILRLWLNWSSAVRSVVSILSRRYGTPCTDIDSMQMVTMALFGSRARMQKGDCVYSVYSIVIAELHTSAELAHSILDLHCAQSILPYKQHRL